MGEAEVGKYWFLEGRIETKVECGSGKVCLKNGCLIWCWITRKNWAGEEKTGMISHQKTVLVTYCHVESKFGALNDNMARLANDLSLILALLGSKKTKSSQRRPTTMYTVTRAFYWFWHWGGKGMTPKVADKLLLSRVRGIPKRRD